LGVQIDPKLDESLDLGKGPVLDDQGKEAVEKIIQDIKKEIARTKQPYLKLEEMVIDIKTIEIQMLSPTPKTEVIREVLRSLHDGLTASGPENLTRKINSLVTS
jgi:hypothetical protein